MWETLKIIENMGQWKPRTVVWENVKGVLDKDMIHSFRKYLAKMEELGYTNSYQVLNAMDFGVPQKRERVFVVSLLGERTFNFSNLEKKEMQPIENYLETEVSELYTIKAPSMLNRIEGVEQKNTGFSGRLKPIKTHAWTITTKQDRCPNSGIIPLGNGKYRVLTERECWRLMGFDDVDFEAVSKEYPSRKNCKNGALYKLAGNSIVVDVLEAIFRELLKMEEKEGEQNFVGGDPCDKEFI